MATFKGVVLGHHKKSDGTYNVKIRVTHDRSSRYISTGYFLTREDLTRSFNIKNQNVVDAIENQIRKYRNTCNTIGSRINEMDVDQVVDFLKKQQERFCLDFVKFGRDRASILESLGRNGTAGNYRVALNALCKFTRSNSIDISEITSSFMQRFLQWIDTRMSETKREKGTRARSLYTGIIRTLHNEAKNEYNDEDSGIVNIPLSPFKKFKVPVDIPPDKRALTVDVIRAIHELPCTGSVRFDLAKDVFMLSFGLVGMNTVDLYNCTCYENGRITYNRTKTTTRRYDKAGISIKVDPRVLPLVEKYRDTSGGRVFNFHQSYSTSSTFSAAVNKGLKQIGKLPAIGISGLQFYAARHSWATIAVNVARIDKYTVHTALNHADNTMRVTDLYIKKDFSLVDEANKKVLDLIYAS
jgi:integrase